MAFTRCIDSAVYPRKAFVKARETYAAYCVVTAVPIESGRAEVTIEVKPEYAGDARQVMLEFWNFLLDTTCELRLAGV
jgi:hypothetical protein